MHHALNRGDVPNVMGHMVEWGSEALNKAFNDSCLSMCLARTDPETFFMEGINKSGRIVNTFKKYLFIIVSKFILIY